MLDSTKTSSALTSAIYSSGSGTETDPYVLKSNAGTVTLQSGNYYVIEDGTTIGTAVVNEYNAQNSTGGLNVNGAHVDIKTGAHIAGKIDMSGTGSTLTLENTSGKWAYQANMAGEDLSAGGDQFYTYPSLQDATVVNFGAGAGICAENVPNGYATNIGIAGTYTTSSGLVLRYYDDSSAHPGMITPTNTPANPNGNQVPGYISIPVTVPSGTDTTTFHVDPNNHCQIDGCFLTGTNILTRDGEKAVETLTAEDEIAVVKDGEIAYQPLAWLGHSHADVAQLGFDPDAYPVRIRKDAFGPGAPHRDLLVTSEHCVFAEGRFIPVRMLVNGRSIISDRSITSYDFYHVELPQHSVIVSEGLQSESYLDTGNRGTFENSVIRTMRPHFAGGIVLAGGKSWAKDAAAPLTTDRASVEPVWNALAARAEELGYAADASAPATEVVTDPALRLVTADGREIRPVRHTGSVYSFMVPAAADSVRIVSHTSRPADVVGPFCDDRRDLGVLVGEISVTNGRDRQALTAHQAADAIDGWQDAEGTAARWTAGNALLSLGEKSEGLFAKMVEIEVLAAGPYLVAAESKDSNVA